MWGCLRFKIFEPQPISAGGASECAEFPLTSPTPRDPTLLLGGPGPWVLGMLAFCGDPKRTPRSAEPMETPTMHSSAQQLPMHHGPVSQKIRKKCDTSLSKRPFQNALEFR